MTTKSKLIIIVIVFFTFAALILIPFFAKTSSGDSLKAGFDSEFLVRDDGYPGLKEAYNFGFTEEPKHMDPGLMYKAVANGSVDVICGFATDGRIPAYDLVTLEDDKNFFPPYYAAPLIRRETLEKHEELRDVLNTLHGQLPDSLMQHLNFQVDEHNKQAAEVARDFLVEKGFIESDAQPGNGEAGTIHIGGKNFTEQEILGEIMAILIESKTDIAVKRRLNLGGTMICFNALEAGDLDLYAEYTGTGLVSILKKDVINDPDAAYNVVKESFLEKYNLLWLKPFGFNNTYIFTMRKEQAEELGIETVSDLAAHVTRE